MPEEMEKRGVACSCNDNPEKDPEDLVKTACGDMACPHCGKPAKNPLTDPEK